MAKLTDAQRKWKKHIDAAKASGETLVDYARAHKLNIQTLYAHNRRLNKAREAHSAPSFVRVQRSAAPGAAGTVRIELPNGVRVVMNAPSDIETLLGQVARLP